MRKIITTGLPQQQGCCGKSVAAHSILTKRALFCLRVVLIASAGVLLCACHTQKHAVTNIEQQSQTTGSHTSVQAIQSFDSLLQTLDFSADSVVIELTQSAQDTAKAGATGKTVAPALKITAHQPRVRATKQENNRVVAQTTEQDSAASSVHANSHADVSNDTVGVATPMNGTLVTIIVLLAVLLIAAIFLWLFLRKYRII